MCGHEWSTACDGPLHFHAVLPAVGEALGRFRVRVEIAARGGEVVADELGRRGVEEGEGGRRRGCGGGERARGGGAEAVGSGCSHDGGR